jgi:hypothetical protein
MVPTMDVAIDDAGARHPVLAGYHESASAALAARQPGQTEQQPG